MMGRRMQLTEPEKGKIIAFKECGLSVRAIAKNLGRSHGVILNFLRLGNAYGAKKSPGRPEKLSARTKSLIVREVSQGESSLRQLARRPDISVSTSTLSRVIRRSGHVRYQKKQVKPRLTTAHKLQRLSWARNHMPWTSEFDRIIFSDEKKFNLDGPDGWRYYWHDLRKEGQIFSKRQGGGGSVMVWAGFSCNGKTSLAFPSGRMNATSYQDLLEEHLLPFADSIAGYSWIFQQDNAPIHTANSTWTWFLDNGVHVMDWPSVSPDLNPMENVWSLLVRALYANGKQYSSIAELRASISSAWQETDQNVLKTLVGSMPDRIFEVIRNSGGHTHY